MASGMMMPNMTPEMMKAMSDAECQRANAMLDKVRQGKREQSTARASAIHESKMGGQRRFNGE